MPAYFAILLLLVIAWGAFAFGAVYEWAYLPLLWACGAIGALGLLAPATRRRAVPWPVAGALALLLLAVALQLWPLAPETIARVSPATDALLRKHDVAYALATTAPEIPYRHPLTIDAASTWLGLACLAAFAVLLLGAARALGRRTLLALAPGLVVLGLLLALTGIVQSGLGVRDREATGLIYGFWKPIYGTNPFGPFVNRNHFAGWMLMALPVVLGYFVALVARAMRGVRPTLRDRVLWLSSPDASRIILVGLTATVMALSLVLTFSRSGILGFMLALLVSAGFVVRGAGSAEMQNADPERGEALDRAGGRRGAGGARAEMQNADPTRTARTTAAGTAGKNAAGKISPARTPDASRLARSRRAVVIGYIVLLAVLAVGWAGVDAVADRFAAAEGTRLNGRLPIWEDTAAILRDFPLAGTGLNTYATAMLFYQVWEPETLSQEAHNDYLQLAAEGGLLLAVPALMFAVFLARDIRRRFRERRDDELGYWLRVGATTGLLAIALQETVEFSLQVPGNAALFVVLAGIALHRSE